MKTAHLILILFLSGCALINPKITTEQAREQTQAVIEAIQNKPEWLFPADACPAEIMPAYEKEISYSSEGCKNKPSECFENCRKDDANACYSLALYLEDQGGLGQIESVPLFLRSCKLGVVSGCTNNAAARLNLETSDGAVKCSADTFEKTCEKNDAWGCSMYGFVLFQGIGRKQNFDQALKALTKSCRHGDDDPACQNANQMREQIEKHQQESQRK